MCMTARVAITYKKRRGSNGGFEYPHWDKVMDFVTGCVLDGVEDEG